MSEDLVLYLKKVNFEKQLKKLKKKLKGKTAIIYGAGQFFRCICENYDLGGIEISGICDRSFENFDGEFLGYKKLKISDIGASGADFVLVATFRYLDITENLEKDLAASKIKVLPLVDRPFFELLKEIWS